MSKFLTKNILELKMDAAEKNNLTGEVKVPSAVEILTGKSLPKTPPYNVLASGESAGQENDETEGVFGELDRFETTDGEDGGIENATSPLDYNKTPIPTQDVWAPSELTYSDDVKAAYDLLTQMQTNAPGTFNGEYQQMVEDAIQKILNREEFSYDLNGDALYQQYKDKFIQQGKQAAADVAGQAAAMTGGYGNSYAATVGNQAYQQSLGELNGVVPELYKLAYDKYNQEGQELYDQYSVLANADAQEYAKHRDEVSDYYTELGMARDDYYNKRDYEYNKWADENTLSAQQHGMEADQLWREYEATVADEQYRHQAALAAAQYEAANASGNGLQYIKEMTGDEITDVANTYVLNEDKAGLLGYLRQCLDIGCMSPATAQIYADELGVDLGINLQNGSSVVPFTGSTYEDAVAYAKRNGLSLSGMLDPATWQRKKNNGDDVEGIGNYNSYDEYLAAYMTYLMETK